MKNTKDECNKTKMNWVVFILECSDNTLYSGITKDIESRMTEHENGAGAKYTKG
ncbi:MAG: GIY-YIG nuclease family protein [Nitrospirota bacterium]|nr:GIY-YIG nuclease family protein [Nitrospirota bacterium]